MNKCVVHLRGKDPENVNDIFSQSFTIISLNSLTRVKSRIKLNEKVRKNNLCVIDNCVFYCNTEELV